MAPLPGPDGAWRYPPGAGEGRLKAFKALGQPTIPARVVTVSDEDAFIMSLAENIARRQCRPLEILAAIKVLHDQGYRGGRYSWGYPASPDLEDNEKVAELRDAIQIGIEVSEETG